MSGTPPDYDPLHLYSHAWLLTGGGYTYDAGTSTWSYTPPSPLGGLADAVGDLQAFSSTTSGDNPYKATTVYDPDASGQPLHGTALNLLSEIATYKPPTTAAATLWAADYAGIKTVVDAQSDADVLMSDAVTQIASALTNFSAPHTSWDTFYDAVVAAVSTGYISTTYTARLAELNVEFLKAAERTMALFNGLDSFDSTTFWAAVAMLDADKQRQANTFLAELQVRLQEAMIAAANDILRISAAREGSVLSAASEAGRSEYNTINTMLTTAAEVYRTELAQKQLGLAYLDLAHKTTVLYMDSMRQNIEDSLKIKVEDILWRVKAYDFFNKGLGAIAGAQVIPGAPNPLLETISSIGQIVSGGIQMALPFVV